MSLNIHSFIHPPIHQFIRSFIHCAVPRQAVECHVYQDFPADVEPSVPGIPAIPQPGAGGHQHQRRGHG